MTLPVSPQIWTLYKNVTGDVGIVKTTTIYNADGTLTNLTGLTLALVVWDGDPSQPLLTSSNVANDGTPTDGVVNWTVSSVDMAALPVSYSGLHVAVRLTSSGYQDTTDPFTLVVKATG